jgi:phage shock protein A
MQQLEKNLDSRAASNLDRKESKIERMEEELTSLQKEVKEKEERLESIRAQTGRDETTMKGHIERLKGEWNKDTLHWLLALLFGIAALESFTPQKKTTVGSLH